MIADAVSIIGTLDIVLERLIDDLEAKRALPVKWQSTPPNKRSRPLWPVCPSCNRNVGM